MAQMMAESGGGVGGSMTAMPSAGGTSSSLMDPVRNGVMATVPPTSGATNAGGKKKVLTQLPKATPTPDEVADMSGGGDVVVVEYSTHESAGEGSTHVGDDKNEMSNLKRSAAQLPKDFINSIYHQHTAKMHVDYLPATSNLNVAKEVGVVKPPKIAEQWEAEGYDPWSANKDPFSTCFVPSLEFEEEGVAEVPKGEFVDDSGLAMIQEEQKQNNKDAEDLDFLFSACRHGKYGDIETAITMPEWTLPIDAQDNAGNTLLSIACQNGNKRIAKLCLRRGADINKQNLAGQTNLHYCFSYGFEDMAEYLMDKGADDSLLNADGLTCYEGLTSESVERI